MSSLCWECKYEHSDCKGDRWIEKVACQYFSKKLAINYPKVIEELERKVEFFESLYQGQLDANEKLLLRKETLEAQNKELKAELKQSDEAYDLQGKQLLEALDEIKKLKFENNKLQQWTLNDRKVRHGFELAIETLKKCKECDTE